MPWIDVKLYDTRVTDESVPKIIEALTEALHESSGAAKEHIHVIVQGVPQSTGASPASRRLIDGDATPVHVWWWPRHGAGSSGRP